MDERISENEKKQSLIAELNGYVGGVIEQMLRDEKQFYEADTRDRLKVPPFNYVKRQPRDYTLEERLLNCGEASSGSGEENAEELNNLKL